MLYSSGSLFYLGYKMATQHAEQNVFDVLEVEYFVIK